MLIIYIRNDESQNAVQNKLYNQLKNCCPCKHFFGFFIPFFYQGQGENRRIIHIKLKSKDTQNLIYFKKLI